MTSLISAIRQLGDVLPLPEDFQLLLVAWVAMVLLVSLVVSFRSKRNFNIRLIAALLLFFVGFMSLYELSAQRIVSRKASETVSILLPLFACGNAEEYWPGGKLRPGAAIQSFRNARDDPRCIWSSTASIAAIMAAWGAVALGLGISIGTSLGVFSEHGILARLLQFLKNMFGGGG